MLVYDVVRFGGPTTTDCGSAKFVLGPVVANHPGGSMRGVISCGMDVSWLEAHPNHLHHLGASKHGPVLLKPSHVINLYKFTKHFSLCFFMVPL